MHAVLGTRFQIGPKPHIQERSRLRGLAGSCGQLLRPRGAWANHARRAAPETTLACPRRSVFGVPICEHHPRTAQETQNESAPCPWASAESIATALRRLRQKTRETNVHNACRCIDARHQIPGHAKLHAIWRVHELQVRLSAQLFEPRVSDGLT